MHNSDVPLKQNYDLLSFYFRPMTFGIFKIYLAKFLGLIIAPGR